MKYIILVLILAMSSRSFSQSNVNYNENAIRLYTLPELFTLNNGRRIRTITEWETQRKPEILATYEQYVYGKIPDNALHPVSVKVIEQSDNGINNSALRKQIEITFRSGNRSLLVNVLLYVPKSVENPPIFIAYNFYGNHTIIDDPDVVLTQAWSANSNEFGISDNRANVASRGKRSHRWPVEMIIEAGYGLATVYYGEVDPDKNDFSDGIHPMFYNEGQTKPGNGEWGSISAWAWGYSRILDYLKTDPTVKESKFILFGHSRLGKTALWAGALDERFDMVISNNSGCGGAALFRRKFGETVSHINTQFPHWFTDNFKAYDDKEEDLPVDQHMLIALMAPRPVYVASAEEDQWADPKGEYLSAFHAGPVYELYGEEGLSSSTPPSVHKPIHKAIGYHIRSGKHDVTDYDWEQYIRFADRHFTK